MAQAQRSDANDDGGGGGDRRPAPKTTTSRFFFTRKVTSRGASNVFQTSSLVPVRRIFSRSSRTDAGRRASGVLGICSTLVYLAVVWYHRYVVPYYLALC